MKHQFLTEYQQQSIKCVIIHYLSKQFCARDLKFVAYSYIDIYVHIMIAKDLKCVKY